MNDWFEDVNVLAYNIKFAFAYDAESEEDNITRHSNIDKIVQKLTSEKSNVAEYEYDTFVDPTGDIRYQLTEKLTDMLWEEYPVEMEGLSIDNVDFEVKFHC